MDNYCIRNRKQCNKPNSVLRTSFSDRSSSAEELTTGDDVSVYNVSSRGTDSVSTSSRISRSASTSSSTTDSEAESRKDLVKTRSPRRSISAYQPKSKHKVERCNSVPELGRLQGLWEESRQLVHTAEDFVKHVISAGWQLVSHHALPDWLKDNEYLLFGHRPTLNSFKACFKSVFRIHTETGNIWTHLLGMIAFVSIAAYTLSSRYIDWMWQDITVHSVFFGGAILCFTFSWLFHAVYCHSERVNSIFSKLDYCGIALLTVGSFVPWLYYSFFCHPLAHIIYLVSIVVLGTGCIVVSLFDRFATPAYRPLRAGLFIALGLTGIIPALHFVALVGLYSATFEYGFLHLVAMAFLYIGGALMYAFRIPERIYPGMFDIWFQSHQIFHVCVILAALVHFRGIQIISHARLNLKECVIQFPV